MYMRKLPAAVTHMEMERCRSKGEVQHTSGQETSSCGAMQADGVRSSPPGAPAASFGMGMGRSDTQLSSAANPTGASSLSVRVPDERREKGEDGWEYSVYSVITMYQGQAYTAQRRYREFRQLHSLLRVHLPALPGQFPLWPHVLNRYAPEVIEARKLGFETYLSDVLDRLQGAVIPQILRTFLSLPKPEECQVQETTMMVQSPLEPTDHVVLVSYQLPVNVRRSAGGGFDIEWDDNAVLTRQALNLKVNVQWVGCISLRVTKEEEDGLAERLFDEFNCVVGESACPHPPASPKTGCGAPSLPRQGTRPPASGCRPTGHLPRAPPPDALSLFPPRARALSAPRRSLPRRETAARLLPRLLPLIPPAPLPLPARRALRHRPILRRRVEGVLHRQPQVCGEGDGGVRAGAHDVGARLPPAAAALVHPPPPPHRAHRPLPALSLPRLRHLPHHRGTRRAPTRHAQRRPHRLPPLRVRDA